MRERIGGDVFTADDHGWHEEQVDFPHSSSFDDGIDGVLLLSHNGDGFILSCGLGRHIGLIDILMTIHDEILR